jgi:DNA mismatch repair protein MutH
MEKSHFFHKEELIKILENVLNKKLGEVDKNNVFARTTEHPKITGIAGDVIEQSVLGYPADQDQRPDLNVDGVFVELKTTGIRETGRGKNKQIVAKEPTSITAVSLDRIAGEEFEDSAFYHKIENLLFVFYHYDSKITVRAAAYADFFIRGYLFYQFSEDNMIIIKKDWQKIHDFVAEVQTTYSEEEAKKYYPNLSTKINKELVFLDTAPKYPHAPRIRLRKRVVTLIVQEKFGKNLEALPDKYYEYKDVVDKCKAITEIHKNKSIADILAMYNVEIDLTKKHKTKQFAEITIVRMFGGESKKMSKINLFETFGIVGKSIAITVNETRTEDMKLFAVDFDELIEREIEDEETSEIRDKKFEDSALYNYFMDNKLLCMVFQEDTADKAGNVDMRENKFLGFKMLDLGIPELIESANNTWETLRDLVINKKLKDVPVRLKNGAIRITPKTKIQMTAPNFPKSENNIVFLRGSGEDAAKKTQEVNGIKMLKQYYWIKGSFIVDKLKETEYL